MKKVMFLFSCAMLLLVAVAPRAAQQGRGGGPGAAPAAAAKQQPNGTLTPKPLDPGRPWGWAVKAFMDDPNRKLYNTAKAKLLSGKQIYGHSISKFDTKAYCEQAPHNDYTWFEMQHSTLWFADIEKMIQACPRVGATPMLRIPEATEGIIQHAVDLGVLGIIVPSVDDAAEALTAAKFARFPPIGRRNVSNSGPTVGMWTPVVPPGSTFRKSMNDNMLVILMIETVEGVNNALEIASTPGLDVVILGNSDLTSFSGFPQTDDRYQDLLTKVRDATYLAGKYWGNAGFQFATGNRLSPDSRFHQNGPSKVGFVPPARAGGPPAQ
jgi:2-keto-3-deoxy-L-rhamnonate aldolase RhmA